MMKKIIFFIFLFIISLFSTGQNKKFDSLWAVYNNKNQPDSNRIKAIGLIAWKYKGNKPDTAIILCELQLKLSRKNKLRNFEAMAHTTMAISFKNKGQFEKALENYLMAKKIYEETGNKNGLGGVYLGIGVYYAYQSDFTKGLENYFKAVRLLEEGGDQKTAGSCYMNIGSLYATQSNNSKALEYYLKALQVREKMGDKLGTGNCYMNIGAVYKNLLDTIKAIDYTLKSLKLMEEIGDRSGVGMCYCNLGGLYTEMADYSKGLDYGMKSLKIRQEIGDKHGLGINYSNIGQLYNLLKNYKMAILYSDSCIQISKETGLIDNERYAYSNLAAAYFHTGKYKEAYENHVKFKKLTDSIFNEENSKQLGDMKTNFEVEKKEAELKIKAEAQQAISAEEKKRQQLIIYSVAGLLVLVLVFAIFMFNRFKVTQKQKTVIEKQKAIVEEQKTIVELQKFEVEKQKHLVEEHQKEIIDSITYAKRLQQAILPSNEEIKKHLPDSFLLYKPKDIVAGDFYWMEHFDETTYIAAADSTGHGVPGAMVSVVCSNALNRSVKEFGLRETGKILDKTRELVLDTFAKSGEEIKDGMDISLLSINSKQISWSGANNQLWYISNQGGDKDASVLREVSPDKQPIGKSDHPKPFTSHIFDFKKGDTFYLMTDGYPDQFGGPKGKKFKYKQLEELLISNCHEPLNLQSDILELKFKEWIGDLEQVDDITIIGIKV